MKIFKKNFALSFVLLFFYSISLNGMFTAPWIVPLCALRKFRSFTLRSAPFVTQADAFASMVNQSAKKITDPRLFPLKRDLSQFLNRKKSILEVWKEGLQKSYHQVLLGIKRDACLSTSEWRSFLKFKLALERKNPISNQMISPDGKRQLLFDLNLPTHLLDVGVEFAREAIPINSKVYLIGCFDTLAKAQQFFLNTKGKRLNPSKIKSANCVQSIAEIMNIISLSYFEPTLQNNQAVLWHCLCHELRHMINNDILISNYLSLCFKKRIHPDSHKHLHHIGEYRADLEPVLQNPKNASMVIKSLSNMLTGLDIFDQMESNLHPSVSNRLRIAELLQNHLEEEKLLE